MLFDTDVLIWFQHGSDKASRAIDRSEKRFISIQTYMELLQGAKNKSQHKVVKSFLKDFAFEILPLTENIGHRAAIYVEQFALSHSMRSGDAIIAATANENNIPLISSNAKHFKCVSELEFKHFKPEL